MGMGISALLSGLVFGAGLTVSRMIDPSKVIGFLDVAGNWDPTLAVVMAGALMVTLPAFALAKRRVKTLIGHPLTLPAPGQIDTPLIAGAILFGIGWGLGGFCPGPGLAALAFGLGKPLVFVAAMVAGMVGYGFVAKKTNV
ncbi:MAG: YeeE/YedE family protein [Rhodospirillales bacterium]|nr:YeeE/YedE family protein [Rhodospirillales bacterium]